MLHASLQALLVTRERSVLRTDYRNKLAGTEGILSCQVCSINIYTYWIGATTSLLCFYASETILEDWIK